MRDPRYGPLFVPTKTGPVTSKNQFHQAPHCYGGGCRDPSAAVQMRGMKAEGGWSGIFTEQCEMHHTSETTPFIELRLWEDKDMRQLCKMSERMKTHSGLAGIHLAYSGINGSNLFSKEVPLAPSVLPILTFINDPIQARALTKADITNLRRWFVNAAQRSKETGLDLVNLYCAHGCGIFQHFLSRATNQRSDAFDGSLENRARFGSEVFGDIRDAVGDTMAIALWVSLDEAIGDPGFSNAEVRDFVEMNKVLPDIWDLARDTWEYCSAPSRFKDEAAQEELVRGIHDLTDKPIVGSGPAGQDAAWGLCRRGYDVVVVEAKSEIGGRVTRESKLPGPSAWGRVVDCRQYQLLQCSNFDIYLNSKLDAEGILEFGFENIAIAIGAIWCRDGVARQHVVPMPISETATVYTPHDLMDGTVPTGNIVIYDNDYYYRGAVLPELLAENGAQVTLITPSAYVLEWINNALEQAAIHTKLVEMGVDIVLNRRVTEIAADHGVSNCVYSGRTQDYAADAVVMIASRLGEDALFTILKERFSNWADAWIKTVRMFGDAEAPGPIAWSSYAGHRYARELDGKSIGDDLPFQREITELTVG